MFNLKKRSACLALAGAFSLQLIYGIGAESASADAQNPASTSTEFKDVPASDPNAPYITDLHQKKLIEGTGNGNFSPNSPLTREQFATMIVRAMNLPYGGFDSPFSDVYGTWSQPYVDAAYAFAMTHGNGPFTFSPKQTLTREEAATMVWNFLSSQAGVPEATDSNTYSSYGADSWAQTSVQNVMAYGLRAEGRSMKIYRPKDVMTRGDAAALVDLAMRQVQAASTTSNGTSQYALLQSFLSASPGVNPATISLVKKAPYDNHAFDIVVVTNAQYNAPSASSNVDSQTYFVSSDRTITPFPSGFDSPWAIQRIHQTNDNFTIIAGIVGAHTSAINVFDLISGKPRLVQAFRGDQGFVAWQQDNTLQVYTSNRTYNWDLVSPSGDKDDSTVNDVYRYNATTQSFTQIDTLTTGTFDPADSRSDNVTGGIDAVNQLMILLSGDQTAYPGSWASTAVADYQSLKSQMSFIANGPSDEFVSLTTLSKGTDFINEQYQANGHTLVILLRKGTTTWQVTGFLVDPSDDTLAPLKAN